MKPSETYARVILPVPVSQLYTYRIPEIFANRVKPGMRAVVQFGAKRIYTGIVFEIHDHPPEQQELKEILDFPDEHPLVTGLQLEFWKWVSEYYMCSSGNILKAAVPSGLRPESETRITVTETPVIEAPDVKEKKILNILENHKSLAVKELSKLSGVGNPLPLLFKLIEKGSLKTEEKIHHVYKPKLAAWLLLNPVYISEKAVEKLLDTLAKAARQKALLESYLFHAGMLKDPHSKGVRQSEILKDPRVSMHAINALVKKKILLRSYHQVDRLQTDEQPTEELKILSDDQVRSLEDISKTFESVNTVLLHGVTSSGKTEIYTHLIARQISQGKQVLYLLPEIALTSQIISRLRKYFGKKIGVYHSRYSDSERVEIWNNLLFKPVEERYQIIIGVRSSVFLPFSNLGLVIIDEEQEPSYKQQDPAPRYHARDAAVYLALLHGAKTLLGTGTPSLESYFNCQTGKYGLVELKQRFGNFSMPHIILANTREAWKRKKMTAHFTPELHAAILDALSNNGQVILFQNRRGFSPYVQCDRCGWIPRCHHCDVNLTYHKFSGDLSCHYCGFRIPIPAVCPGCKTPGIKTKGMGTEKIEEEVGIVFPEARVKRMDLDTTRSKKSFHKILSDFENHKTDILIGTQMVSKGLDFEKVTLVGVLNADNLLYYPDFRSYERTYHLLAQVSGRAGRKKSQGRVIIQTSEPEHPVLQWVVKDTYKEMFRNQMMERKRFFYPPFYRLIKVTLRHRNKKILDIGGVFIGTQLRLRFKKQVLGPEPPLISKIQNWHLKVAFLKLEKHKQVSRDKKILLEIIARAGKTPDLKGLQIIIDVDPM